jgi:phytoene dehydrogenase-like protein
MDCHHRYCRLSWGQNYVPQGGMQELSNVIVARFQDMGGELWLSSLVKKICVQNGSVTGVIINNKDFIPSTYVISNCDARQTFLDLLGNDAVDDGFNRQLASMIPTMSNYILYLGMSAGFDPPLNPGTFYYYLNDYDVESAYEAIYRGDHSDYNGFAIRISPDRSTIYTGMPANYKSPQYWKRHKYEMLERFISKVEETAIPGLSQYIMYKDAATPSTLRRYTLNYHGASYGWAGTPSQIILSSFRKPSFIRNLYLVGHWTTFGVGISGVAYVGYDTAISIVKRANRKNVLLK